MSRLILAAKKSFSDNLRFLRLLVADRRELVVPRVIALLSIVAFVAYTRSPYQLIPENVPVFGYFDDVSILVFGFVAARRFTPREWLGFTSAAAAATGGLDGLVPNIDKDARPGERRPRPASLYDALGYRNAWRVKSTFATRQRYDDSVPIVVGGCGRSGTTLLRTILNRHPDIACGDESTVFLSRISSPEQIGWRYGLAPDAVAHMMRQSRSQAEFISRFERACLDRFGKTVWAEKTPENVLRFPFVRKHFPNAHLVHVIRDGRDVVCSLRRQRWFKVREAERSTLAALEYAVDYWAERVEAGLRFRGHPLYHEVKYENLIESPDETLRTLFDGLTIDWHPSLLEASDGDARPHYQPIYASAVEQWRAELAAPEIELIERKAGPLLRSLGYPA